jgi:hypothetical protein
MILPRTSRTQIKRKEKEIAFHREKESKAEMADGRE